MEDVDIDNLLTVMTYQEGLELGKLIVKQEKTIKEIKETQKETKSQIEDTQKDLRDLKKDIRQILRLFSEKS